MFIRITVQRSAQSLQFFFFFLESEPRQLVSFKKSNDLPLNKDSQKSATKTKLLIIPR